MAGLDTTFPYFPALIDNGIDSVALYEGGKCACDDCEAAPGDLFICARCNLVQYCGSECQSRDRDWHRPLCKEIKDKALAAGPDKTRRVSIVIDCAIVTYVRGLVFAHDPSSSMTFLFGSSSLPGSFLLKVSHCCTTAEVQLCDASLPRLTVKFSMEPASFKKIGVLVTCLPQLGGAARDRFLRDRATDLRPETDVDVRRQVMLRVRLLGALGKRDLLERMDKNSRGPSPARTLPEALIRMYDTIDDDGSIERLPGCVSAIIECPGDRGVLMISCVPRSRRPVLDLEIST